MGVLTQPPEEADMNTGKMALHSVCRRAVINAVKMQQIQQVAKMGHQAAKIGNREVVGFGYNGDNNYVDRIDFPMPAIRFKENTPDVQTYLAWENVHGMQEFHLQCCSSPKTCMRIPIGDATALCNSKPKVPIVNMSCSLFIRHY